MKKTRRMLFLAGGLLALLLLAYLPLAHTPAGEPAAEDASVVLHAVDPARVSDIALTHAGETNIFRREGAGWVREGDPDFPVYQERVEKMAEAFESFKTLRLVAERAERPADFGLDAPLSKLRVSIDGASYAYAIGAYNAAQDGYYLGDLGSGTVYLLKAYMAEKFLYGTVELIEREELVQLDYDALLAIEIEDGARRITLRRNASGLLDRDGIALEWEVSGGESAQWEPAGAGAVRAFREELFGSTLYFQACTHYRPDAAALTAAGMDAPLRLRIAYRDASGADAELLLELGADAGADSVYARTAARPDILYRIDREQVEAALGADATTFAPRELCRIPLAALERMEIRYEGEQHALETAGGYRVDGRAIPDAAAQAMYTAFLNLRAERIIEEQPEPAECLLEITLKRTGEADTTLEFHPYDNNFYLVAHNGSRTQLVSRVEAHGFLRAFQAM